MALGAQLVIDMRGARLSIRELGKWFKPRLRVSNRFWIMCLLEKEGWHREKKGGGGWREDERHPSREESGLSSFFQYIRKCVSVELFLGWNEIVEETYLVCDYKIRHSVWETACDRKETTAYKISNYSKANHIYTHQESFFLPHLSTYGT